jgi:hypothetical protein
MYAVVSFLDSSDVVTDCAQEWNGLSQVANAPIRLVSSMRRRKKSVYWQLDLFIVVMIAGRLVLIWADLPDSWSTIIDWVWSVLTLAGMSAWVWFNREALREEDQRARRKAHQHPPLPARPMSPRTLPLTPVQRHFLDVIDTARKTEVVAGPRDEQPSKPGSWR